MAEQAPSGAQRVDRPDEHRGERQRNDRALGEAEAVKLGWKPQNETTVTGDDAEKLMKLIDALEEDDDVQTVWGNYDVPDEELERLA